MTEETWLAHHRYRKQMVRYVEQRKRAADTWREWRGDESHGYPSIQRAYVRAARRFIHLHGLDMVDVDRYNPERLDRQYLFRRASKVSARLKAKLATFRVSYPGQPPKGFSHVGALVHSHPPSKPRTLPAYLVGWFPRAASYDKDGYETRKSYPWPIHKRA